MITLKCFFIYYEIMSQLLFRFPVSLSENVRESDLILLLFVSIHNCLGHGAEYIQMIYS
jgi:hypothetical protein